jgi:exopolysaccharide biosynthesis protein
VVSNGTISGVVTAKSTEGNVTLEDSTMVLSGYDTGATTLDTLAVGDSIIITVSVDDIWSDVVECVGGGRPDGAPLLVSGSAVYPEDTTVSDYDSFYGNNPRTAVGIRADGSYFFYLVDGRQTGVSEGASIAELSQFGVDLGAQIAVNLDGGRSSSMIIDENLDETYTLVNIPADRGNERSDGNSVFVVTE